MGMQCVICNVMAGSKFKQRAKECQMNTVWFQSLGRSERRKEGGSDGGSGGRMQI